jgi:syndecan 1
VSIWDRFRSRSGAPEPAPPPVAPVAAEAPPPDGGWRAVPAPSTTVRLRGIGVSDGLRFRSGLASWQNPVLASEPAHAVLSSAPAGLVHGVLRPVQRAERRGGGPLLLAVPGGEPATVERAADPVGAARRAAAVRPMRTRPSLVTARAPVVPRRSLPAVPVVAGSGVDAPPPVQRATVRNGSTTPPAPRPPSTAGNRAGIGSPLPGLPVTAVVPGERRGTRPPTGAPRRPVAEPAGPPVALPRVVVRARQDAPPVQRSRPLLAARALSVGTGAAEGFSAPARPAGGRGPVARPSWPLAEDRVHSTSDGGTGARAPVAPRPPRDGAQPAVQRSATSAARVSRRWSAPDDGGDRAARPRTASGAEPVTVERTATSRTRRSPLFRWRSPARGASRSAPATSGSPRYPLPETSVPRGATAGDAASPGSPAQSPPTAGPVLQRSVRPERAGRTAAARDNAAPAPRQPTARPPAAGKPAAPRSAAAEPVSGTPAPGRSAAEKPTVRRPASRGSAAGGSATGQPVVQRSSGGETLAGPPAAPGPVAGKSAVPGSTVRRPATGNTAAGPPAARDAAARKPAGGGPAVPRSATAGEPAARETPAGTPAVGKPAVRGSVAGKPAAGGPVVQRAAVGESPAGEPTVRRSVAGGPTAGEPVVRRLAARGPAVGGAAVGKPAAGEPVVPDPVAGEPVARRPVVQRSSAGGPVAGQPVARRPAVEGTTTPRPAVRTVSAGRATPSVSVPTAGRSTFRRAGTGVPIVPVVRNPAAPAPIVQRATGREPTTSGGAVVRPEPARGEPGPARRETLRNGSEVVQRRAGPPPVVRPARTSPAGSPAPAPLPVAVPAARTPPPAPPPPVLSRPAPGRPVPRPSGVVQREAVAGVPPGVPVSVAVAPRPTPTTGTGTATTGDEPRRPAALDLDDLARRLIGPVLGQVRAELRRGRERIGRPHDGRR